MARGRKGRTQDMHNRRRKAGLCINGRSWVLWAVPGGPSLRLLVERFLEEGRRCQFRSPSGELIDRPVPKQWNKPELPDEVQLDPDAHGPAFRGSRCAKCWAAKLEAEQQAKRAAREAAAAQAAAPLPPARALPPRRGGRRKPPASQGAFSWAS